jgi:PTH2 family peptidyl-tRNA hydrolase
MSQFKYKQCIIIRSDLRISCGKAVTQACHASVTVSDKTRKIHPDWWHEWFAEGQRKITLSVRSLEELHILEEKAKKKHVPSALISDMGLTELPPHTVTALGLGPAPSKILNKITGSLPLF